MTTALAHNTAARSGTRDPARTRERILNAGFREFAAKGFAGARVDAIARNASINKRMLYHYFGNKKALFREVLRRKLAQRKVWTLATPDDPAESVPYWFDLACSDKDWIRLLEWEALQFAGKKIIDEELRASTAAEAVQRVMRRQQRGSVRSDLDAGRSLLAMIALSWFPLAFPQLTRLITGQSSSEERFRKPYREFLGRFAISFRGKGLNR